MKYKRMSALLLAAVLTLLLTVTAFAASSTTSTILITLTVANEYHAVNVTVPASLPDFGHS